MVLIIIILICSVFFASEIYLQQKEAPRQKETEAVTEIVDMDQMDKAYQDLMGQIKTDESEIAGDVKKVNGIHQDSDAVRISQESENMSAYDKNQKRKSEIEGNIESLNSSFSSKQAQQSSEENEMYENGTSLNEAVGQGHDSVNNVIRKMDEAQSEKK